MRDVSVLSDIEFEELVADLLAADLGLSVERFARGPDGGVDLRWTTPTGKAAIGQCKHYVGSTFSQLRAAARREVAHVENTRPERYLFITSQDLTVPQKAALVGDMSPWLAGPQDVLGSRDIDGMITRFPHVEQAHPKLWLSTGTQLFWATHADLAARSAALRSRIDLAIPRYVANASFARGQSILAAQSVCVIAGLPGIGKTMLAYALVADAMSDGFEPVEVSGDINDAWTAYRTEAPQVFLYDDFLGQLSFSERLGKNEDARLSDFIGRVAGVKSKLLVMTTREYILQDARRVYPKLGAIDDANHLVLELHDYTREERARILYNHLWHSDLPSPALAEVAADGCLRIVDHPNYSPRLIEYCTGPAFDRESQGYVERFLDSLEHPEQIWRAAFEDHLDAVQRLIAVALATLPARTDLDDLMSAHESLCRSCGVATTAAQFRNGVQVLEGTFLAVEMAYGTSKVRFHNPSIRAFVLDWLGRDQQLVADVIRSAIFFEQVSYLHRFATGSRGTGAVTEPTAAALMSATSSLGQEVTAVLTSLIMSPTPERGGKYVGDVNRPQESWFEDRLRFLIDLPAEVRPSAEWLVEQLQVAVVRWGAGEGHKGRASQLVQSLERRTDLTIVPEDEIQPVSGALDAWLATDLEETEEDWLPYLERLEETHGIPLEEATDVAAQFEEHALGELDRWSPSPPDLPILIEYARRLGLDGLVEALEEKAHEDERRDEAPDRDRSPGSARVPRRTMSDADLVQMFARLRPSE